MRSSLAALCGRFIENRDRIKSGFGWEYSYIYPVCAEIFADKRQEVSVERMKECWALLKEKTGIFSNFRGMIKLIVMSMMAVDSDPERKLNNALTVYSELKERFWRSPYLPVVSMTIADMVEPGDYGAVADKTKRIYNLMKSEHPFLTSDEDSVFAALLALSDLTEEQAVSETEACYDIMKEKFFFHNNVQSLSNVLALGEGSAEEKCRKTMEIYDGLKERGRRYGTGYELATLGALALLPESAQTIVEDILEVDKFLSGQKGYGILGPGKKHRLMHAGMLVGSDYIGGGDDKAMSSAAISGAIALIIAQQIAICAAVAASSAAASSASSSS